MEDPESLTWIRENTFPFIDVPEEERCCVEGCRSRKTIRNFTCLEGVWKVKNNCKHRKVCIYHYNHDLKLNPRKPSKKRKRVKTRMFERKTKRRKRKSKIYICCIFGCQKEASVRKFSCLKGKWVLKEGRQNKRENKICNWHYMIDRTSRDIENRRSETDGLTLLLCASLFV